MAEYTIDKIEYDGNVYKLQDNQSGYITNAGVTKITTTAGAHTAITNSTGAVSFNVPTTAAHVGASASDHAHGNITNGGDITATAPTIANGDQLIINDHSESKITNGPTFDGSTATKALTQKGTWETFNNYSLPLAASDIRGGVKIGYSESGTNYAVKLSSEQMYVSVPWTDTKVTVAALNSSNIHYPILATGTGTATRQIDSTIGGFKYSQVAGTTSEVGISVLYLGNATASGTANNTQGVFRLYGTTSNYIDIQVINDAPTTNRTITFPDKSGTIALTDDIPTITLNDSATTSPSFYAPTSVGTNGYVLKSNGSGAPTWTSATLTDENVKSTAVTAATTNYIVGSTTSTTTTGTLSKHASGVLYTTANTVTNGYTQLRLGNTTPTSTAGGKEGQIRLYGTTATYYVNLKAGSLNANRTITLPNASGTIALTSHITDEKLSTALLEDNNQYIYYPILGDDSTSASTKYYTKGMYFTTDPTYMAVEIGVRGSKRGMVGISSNSGGTAYIYATGSSLYTINLPAKSGTLATTDDVPQIQIVRW